MSFLPKDFEYQAQKLSKWYGQERNKDSVCTKISSFGHIIRPKHKEWHFLNFSNFYYYDVESAKICRYINVNAYLRNIIDELRSRMI